MVLRRRMAYIYLSEHEAEGGYSDDAQDDEDEQHALQTGPMILPTGLFMLRLIGMHVQSALSSAKYLPAQENGPPVHLFLSVPIHPSWWDS
jgi:hypothetical protein